jgi:hypothetical protein
MNKNTEIFGIDISKDVFDVYSLEMGIISFKNDAKALNQFIKSDNQRRFGCHGSYRVLSLSVCTIFI